MNDEPNTSDDTSDAATPEELAQELDALMAEAQEMLTENDSASE